MDAFKVFEKTLNHMNPPTSAQPQSPSLCTKQWFMTYHGKRKSVWQLRILKEKGKDDSFVSPQEKLCQTFYDANRETINPLFFQFIVCPENSKEDSLYSILQSHDVYITGELVQDVFSNTILLAHDICSLDYLNFNIEQRHNILYEFLNCLVPTSLDPFLVQVKILYPFDPSVLDYFFKSILIQYNVDLEGIMVVSTDDWDTHDKYRIVGCKNRVTLDMEALEKFLEIVPKISIVETMLDFHERQSLPFKHGDKKTFYTKKDKDHPDIFYLFETADCTGPCYLASIPSYQLSLFINTLSDHFVMEYFFHEFQQKWIPNVEIGVPLFHSHN
jgi:hypothetical protein